MDRRDVLKGLGAIAANAFATPAIANPCESVKRFGAEKPSVIAPTGERFYSQFAPMRGAAKEAAKERKNVFLFKHLEEALGAELVPHWQGTDPESGAEGEGDCVGHAGAICSDTLAATDIFLRNEPERFVAKSSVEMLYSGGRIEIGKLGRPDENPNQNNYLAGRGGSCGSWMARWLNEYGVLHRLVYDNPDGTKLDLTGYDPGRSRQYRDIGVPDFLEPIAKEHPIKAIANIREGIEGVDAIAAGHPLIVCSSYAFESVRDANGFATARGAYRRGWKRFRVQWWHAMAALGVVIMPDGSIGVLIVNSHGDWNSGPRPFGIPRGSFFVTLKQFDVMVKDWFDVWSLGSYAGHESHKMKKRIHKLWR